MERLAPRSWWPPKERSARLVVGIARRLDLDQLEEKPVKKTLAAAAVLAALALTGCSASTQSAEPAPSPTVASSAPATASATPSETATSAQTAAKTQESKGSQERADEIMDLFLKSYDRKDFSEFSDGTPHQTIKEWYLKADNKTFVIILDSEESTFWLANDFLERVHGQADIEKVTVLDKNNYGASRTLADLS